MKWSEYPQQQAAMPNLLAGPPIRRVGFSIRRQRSLMEI